MPNAFVAKLNDVSGRGAAADKECRRNIPNAYGYRCNVTFMSFATRAVVEVACDRERAQADSENSLPPYLHGQRN
jgi:hypothetical protein